MRHIILLYFILALVSCSESETKPKRNFDYKNYKNYKLENLHVEIKLPKELKHLPFNQLTLDSLMEESKTNPFDRQRSMMISSLFQQKQGKLEMFVDYNTQRHFIIASFPQTYITKELVKQMGQGMKTEIKEINEAYGYDIKLNEVLIGNAGKVSYALFKTESSFGNNNSFMVTLGLRSWRMYYYGDENLDHEAVLNSVKFPN